MDRADITRRHVLRLGAALATLPFAARIGWAAGEDALRLEAKKASQGAAFNGFQPGPVLRLKRGVAQDVNVLNGLEQPFALEPYGLRGLGLPENPASGLISPGVERTISLTPPDAGTYLYRAIPQNGDTSLLAQGLAGALIVEEDAPTPGFDQDLTFTLARMSNGLSAHFNGEAPALAAARSHERIRLRMVHAGADSLISLRFIGLALSVIAVDGQPCPPFPPEDNRIALVPGGRIEVAMDVMVTPGEEARIVDELDGDKTVFSWKSEGLFRDKPLADLPMLPQNAALPEDIPLQKAARFRVQLGEEPSGVFKAKAGQSVVVTFENATSIAYSAHVQGHSARLLDGMDDGWKPWWHDTVLVLPRGVMRLAFQANTPGRFALEGLPLESGFRETRMIMEVG